MTFDNDFWTEYRSLVPRGIDPEYSEFPAAKMREDAIVHYLYLTKRIVAKMKKTMPQHVEGDDLESWAKIGLMQAVQRFNHEIQVPFEAFATQRMYSVIRDGIRGTDWASRSLRKKQRDISTYEEKFQQTKKRKPTDVEIAEALDVEPEDVTKTKYMFCFKFFERA